METIEIKDFKDLPQGANPHQAAFVAPIRNGLDYEVLSHGDTPGFIDFLNLSQAVRIMSEFFDVCACTITKENLICAAALGADLDEAYAKVIDCDPLSTVGACAGFSRNVTLNIAKQLYSMKIKNVIAPGYDKEAFKYLLDTGIKIVKVNTPLHELQGFDAKDIMVTPFGVLIQEQNLSKLTKDNFTVVSETKPTQEQAEDAIFGWKVSKYLKNRSALIAKNLCTQAIIQGRPNEVISAEMGTDYACEQSKDSVLIVNETIEDAGVINAAIQGRIGLIVEPGGGKNSKEILKRANKYGLAVIYTKIKNNRY